MGLTSVPQLWQNVIIMRHGDRKDNFEPLWTATADRPWDPPLVDQGLARAFCTGRRLRTQLGLPIHRAFVSPFLRCLQTASQAVSALCAVNDDDPTVTTASDSLQIDSSKIKVSVEFGLCEALYSPAIRPNVVPQDRDFRFVISQCEASLPAGTIDHNAPHVHEKLLEWGESVEGAKFRYVQVIKALADKIPSENMLLVSHGEGVGSVVKAFVKNVDMVYDVDYCGYAHFKRTIDVGEDGSFTAGDFELVSLSGIQFTLKASDK